MRKILSIFNSLKMFSIRNWGSIFYSLMTSFRLLHLLCKHQVYKVDGTNKNNVILWKIVAKIVALKICNTNIFKLRLRDATKQHRNWDLVVNCWITPHVTLFKRSRWFTGMVITLWLAPSKDANCAFSRFIH